MLLSSYMSWNVLYTLECMCALCIVCVCVCALCPSQSAHPLYRVVLICRSKQHLPLSAAPSKQPARGSWEQHRRPFPRHKHFSTFHSSFPSLNRQIHGESLKRNQQRCAAVALETTCIKNLSTADKERNVKFTGTAAGILATLQKKYSSKGSANNLFCLFNLQGVPEGWGVFVTNSITQKMSKCIFKHFHLIVKTFVHLYCLTYQTPPIWLLNRIYQTRTCLLMTPTLLTPCITLSTLRCY